jgi:3-deoxy-D-manno-octulosonic acid kinase
MMNGRRVATASGAILADAALLDAARVDPARVDDARVDPARVDPARVDPARVDDARAAQELFDPGFWASHGRITPVGGGRGAAWFIDHGSEQWVLRHYRRGGFIARLSGDRYLWAGEARVRAFAEYRLLAELAARGLPVPVPVGARYERRGLWYRCDLITRRIAGAASMSGALATAPLGESTWRRVGSTIAQLHAAGVDHADLNAHNILVDGQGAVSIIDFDRGRVRRGGAWAGRNLSRLHRSLSKISTDLPPGRFSSDGWRSLVAGYAERRATDE